ncbi:phosphate transporter PHO1-like isoform X2 [Tripterygium wilfordii]|uniref:phosphate transporter PHO1-like isoform X2 n=1 Tax=Tripterygium wilfordii TaxID=458696 RepID=UPI0018F7E598|nr:phosphate transporter PHO1-like isoform X2 [Tripterygium wilfordii]
MVKFSKELEAQLIPEWKDAFVNYWQLKKHIKKIKIARIPNQSKQLNHDFGLSIFDPVRCFLSKISSTTPHNNITTTTEVIQVKSKTMHSDDTDDEEEQVYQTDLVHLFSEEDEVKEFFERLNDELNKVNQFYKTKEGEFVERGEILLKQLQILLDLKQILNERRRKLSPGILPRSWPSSGHHSDFSESPAGSIDEASTKTDEIIAALEKNGVNFINSASTRAKTKQGKPKMAMRIDIPSTTPTRTITAVTSMLWEDLVNNPKKQGPGDFINRKKIQCAEKMIRGAFVELYRGLGLLKTYSSLNMMAFSKILKKFDKVANRQESANYLKVVKRSHFISSDKEKGHEVLKTATAERFTHGHIFRRVYAILAHLAGVFSPGTGITYMETVYPVFSVFALLSLHLFMYGCNLFMWKSMRINYNFIFEFQPNTALKYRDAFLICTTFMTSVVGAMVIHLLLRANGFFPSHVDAIPGILLLIFLVLLVCPFNVPYRPTRFCFIRIIRNIVFSPLYKVLMVDFFMADQLTSQIPLLRHLESTACYFLAGSFKTHSYKTCNSTRLYRELAYVISFMPYYWRAMQCARRWFDESDLNHLANMGKYVSAMVAAGARITYSRQSDNLWFAIVLVTSVAATIYQLYWDFVKDWGILNTKSKNPWLRDDLVLKNKSVYYLSIALNVVLRVVWVETIMGFHFNMVESRLLDFFMASLEIIRRGHWNFYRLENEHLNNVGKFRAVKAVPLPFRETDSDS